MVLDSILLCPGHFIGGATSLQHLNWSGYLENRSQRYDGSLKRKEGWSSSKWFEPGNFHAKEVGYGILSILPNLTLYQINFPAIVDEIRHVRVAY
jgi:hypothetical protein